MIPPHITGAIERYNQVSRDLADLYIERSRIQNAILQDWQDAYDNAVASGMAYNPAAAQAKGATVRWTIELNKIQGSIDSALVELRYLDLYIATMKG